jgi:hypothetical protein
MKQLVEKLSVQYAHVLMLTVVRIVRRKGLWWNGNMAGIHGEDIEHVQKVGRRLLSQTSICTAKKERLTPR